MDTDGPSRGGKDEALLDALAQTSFTIMSIVTEVAARNDLSLTLLRVLAILRDRTPTMTELAQHLGLNRSTISGLINRAVDRGLVERVENGTDARSHRVTLTNTGSDLAAKEAEAIATKMAPYISHLSVTERDRLTRLLRALNTIL